MEGDGSPSSTQGIRPTGPAMFTGNVVTLDGSFVQHNIDHSVNISHVANSKEIGRMHKPYRILCTDTA